MNISIVGTGYVGLVSGVCFAAKGHKVICVDKQKAIVDKIMKAEATIYEPSLQELLEQSIACGRLTATDDLDYAIENSDITFLTVDTPYKAHSIDLGHMEEASEEIGRLLKIKDTYHVVCVKSTVTPTTTDTLVRCAIERESGKKAGEFGLVMNPEFLREGEAVADFLYPDRIVIGAYDERSYEAFVGVYEGFFDAPIIRVNLRTAELIKYASNSLLAMLISYSNEIAAISEAIGCIDVEDVLYGLSMDKRLSPGINGERIRPDILKYLKAGRGYGGSCFPKDINSLIAFSEQKGYTPELLKAVTGINERQAGRVLGMLETELGNLEGKKILILGLSFKQNSDDIRESQAIKLIRLLFEKGVQVSAADPAATARARQVLGEKDIEYLKGLPDANSSFDAVVLMTAWKEYVDHLSKGGCKALDTKILFDGCRVLQKNIVKGTNIKYMGIGTV